MQSYVVTNTPLKSIMTPKRQSYMLGNICAAGQIELNAHETVSDVKMSVSNIHQLINSEKKYMNTILYQGMGC